MRIDSISLHRVTTPRHEGIASQHVIVRLTCEDGIEGIGEMPDFSHLPALVPDLADLHACLSRVLVGRDAVVSGTRPSDDLKSAYG